MRRYNEQSIKHRAACASEFKRSSASVKVRMKTKNVHWQLESRMVGP